MEAKNQTKESTNNGEKANEMVEEEEEIVFAQPPLYPSTADSSWSSSSNRGVWFSAVAAGAGAASCPTNSYNHGDYDDVDIENGDYGSYSYNPDYGVGKDNYEDGNGGDMLKEEDADGNGGEDTNGGGGDDDKDDDDSDSSAIVTKDDVKKKSSTIRERARHVTNKARKHAQQTAQKAKTLLLLGKEDWSWEELQQIEKRRRETLKKNGLPFFRKLLVWDGTVVAALIKDPLIYIVALLYLGARMAARYTVPEFVSRLGGANIEIVGGFLTFFLIFYVQYENKRFDTMYNLSMGCEGRIFDVAAILRTYAPRDRALRLIRYMNATVRLLYCLFGLHPFANGFPVCHLVKGTLSRTTTKPHNSMFQDMLVYRQRTHMKISS